MEHPVREIASVITTLTTGSVQEQQDTLTSFFVPHASFTHPLCRVPSFSKGTVPLAPGLESRWLLLCIYRWYRTLSPNIDIHIDSAVFDQRSGQLFVSIRQTFAIWFIPLYKAPVKLTTVLNLEQHPASETSPSRNGNTASSNSLSGPGQERLRYFIAHQEDLYQMNDLIQFVCPWLGPLLWFFWQLVSTGLCVAGAVVLLPLYLLLNKGAKAKKVQ
ncbi:flavin-binding monooxygenase-like protein [Purpureocillium lilacinum]|uniref:Flavin-binding monooxygenase-like protein n=1 Tax=Purpureocillium lilacinum TaxID=33203 RepID=A0A179H429_PURLI|nr:flavin-binding monooxygenase-like protein [Purpureocillium lilacinum]KAK4085937.1 hypothetical protein Purlil1_9678 [Purpureocillium lilacinum]OAQ84964.1 flavin-binding monooxygenase-like protein [Purpureocillium lilacinum]OAQ89514.1 flavin-binding monooxygenase-like protein [Purpureocillium lilacinum]